MTAMLVRAFGPLRLAFQRRSLALKVRHVDLRDRGLDLGIRMVLASDLHARNDWFPRALVSEVVDAINELEDVDVVALLGDFVGNDLTAIHWSADEYARIDAPTTGVLGNHDHWLDAANIEQVLTDAGVRMLTNRACRLDELIPDHAGDGWIAGIDSCWTRRRSTGQGADPSAAFAVVPEDADVVVLGHEPHLATLHEHVLHVAGHTHCGQVRSPIFGDWTARMHMPRFSEPYPCRLYELPVDAAAASTLPATHRTTRGKRWVYTTSGIGYSTVDVRTFCPPELVVIDC